MSEEFVLTQEQIDSMPSHERVNFIMVLRRKQLSSEELSDDEVRTAVRLLRTERAANSSRGKSPAAPMSLDEF